jgi:hypothetical protein
MRFEEAGAQRRQEQLMALVSLCVVSERATY